MLGKGGEQSSMGGAGAPHGGLPAQGGLPTGGSRGTGDGGLGGHEGGGVSGSSGGGLGGSAGGAGASAQSGAGGAVAGSTGVGGTMGGGGVGGALAGGAGVGGALGGNGGGGNAGVGGVMAGSAGTGGEMSGGAGAGGSDGEEPTCESAGGQTSAGQVLWAKQFGNQTAHVLPRAIAVTPGGEAAIGGRLWGDNIDFGVTQITSRSDADPFVIRLGANGDVVTANDYNLLGISPVTALSMSPDGALAVAGTFTHSVDFGAGEILAYSWSDIFLATFDSQRELGFAEGYGGRGRAYATGVSLAADHSVTLVGHFSDDLDVGGGSMTSQGLDDVLVATFEQNGDYAWAVSAGDANLQQASAVARAANDDLFVIGSFKGALGFPGCASLISVGTRANGYLAWLDGEGNCIDGVGLTDQEYDVKPAAVAHSRGASHYVAVVGQNNTTGFVSLFEASEEGALVEVWRHMVPYTALRGVSFDELDNVVVVGSYSHIFSSSHGNVTKYGIDGSELWSFSFEHNSASGIRDLAIDGCSNIFVTGDFNVPISLPTGTLTPSNSELFVIKFAP